MGTKITYIRLPDGTSRIRGIGSNREREFFLGMPCDTAWGGGKIASMELVEGSNQLVEVRKDRPFIGPPDASKGNAQEKFNAIVVSVEQYIPVEDEPKAQTTQEPPPAKPVQQQVQQQRR